MYPKDLKHKSCVKFAKNGQNWAFCLKKVLFSTTSACIIHSTNFLFISPIAFTITFRQIYIFKKSSNIALTDSLLTGEQHRHQIDFLCNFNYIQQVFFFFFSC